MTERRVAVLYALAFVPTAAAALAVSGWVMNVSERQAPGAPSGVDGWALNVIPAFATALCVYLLLARYVRSGRAGGSGFRKHILRSTALYLVAISLGVLLLHEGPRPEFWTFGQLVLWVWLTATAGILADRLGARPGTTAGIH